MSICGSSIYRGTINKGEWTRSSGLKHKALAKATLEQIGVDYIESSAPTQSASGQSLYRVMANSYSLR